MNLMTLTQQLSNIFLGNKKVHVSTCLAVEQYDRRQERQSEGSKPHIVTSGVGFESTLSFEPPQKRRDG